MIQEQVKLLWQRCFNDSDAFTELYFRMRYREDINLALFDHHQLAAALQILPYPITFHRETLPMGYISGACTAPNYRNQGLMGQLLRQALEKMYQEGTALSTLIPAEPWLFDYYAQFGYASVFQQVCSTYHYQSVMVNACPSEEVLEVADDYGEEVASFMEEQYRRHYPCCILHPASDLQVIYAALHIDQGHSYLLRQQGKLKAVAFATPTGDTSWRIDEIIAMDKKAGQHLLQRICEHLHLSSITVLSSFSASHGEGDNFLGMARIVQAHRMLQLHAQAHPELTMHLSLHDNQLPVNNGYYHLRHGACTYSSQPTSASYHTCSIAELTRDLLVPEHPHMGLMLN